MTNRELIAIDLMINKRRSPLELALKAKKLGSKRSVEEMTAELAALKRKVADERR